MEKYFVWRFSEKDRYRVYGTRNHIVPAESDARCVWRGDSMSEARMACQAANNERLLC